VSWTLIAGIDGSGIQCRVMSCRPFFIGNYLAGVEAFVDEYWLVIHRVAGWGALRAWLMASRS
jgi:hypothetical protein